MLSGLLGGAGDQLDEWLNILQAVQVRSGHATPLPRRTLRRRVFLVRCDGAAWQLPFALLPVLHFTSSRNEMGEFQNSALLSGNGLSGNDLVGMA